MKTEYNNYFPPTIIECYKYVDGEYINFTKSTYPSDGNYHKQMYGAWRVKYKKLNPLYYCEGQLDVHKKCSPNIYHNVSQL